MRYCITGPSACSQLTERVVVVGSYTRMFLGPLRGTEGGREKCLFMQCGPNISSLVSVFELKNEIHCNLVKCPFYSCTQHYQNSLQTVFTTQRWSLTTLAQVLTCLSSITDGGSFSVTVQGNNPNIVVGVWQQLLQQSCGGGPRYQNLHRDTEHVSLSGMDASEKRLCLFSKKT